MKHSILFTSSLIGLAASQTANYGQCGGQNWSGSTDCNTGWSCQYQNAWYSQCLPESSSSSAASACSAPTTLTTTTSASSTTTSPPATSGSTGGSLPYAKGTSFVVDGKEGYIAGSNSYWISFLTNNADVDLVMGHLQSSGLKFLRVWGFNDVNSDPSSSTVWFQKLENGQQTINTGANGLQRLDYVVKSAEAHGIKLIIPFVNYWNDYGGMNAYVNNYGGNLTEWYTNTAAQSAYQNYIKVVVGRYIGSPAIFAWELANEPRCRECSTDVIYNWAKTTSEFIKTLEPNRMVCIGDEGMGLTTGSDGSYPYTFYEGNDWEKTLRIPTIDFGTFHLYPSQWSEQDSWGSSWVTTHGAACKAAGKPCLFEEYGSDTHSNEAPWQTTAIGSVAADSFWQWGDTLSSGNSPNDNYAIYYGSSDYTTLVTNHVAAINGAA